MTKSVASVLGVLFASSLSAAFGDLTIERRGDTNVLEVRIGGELFTAYHYPDGATKPYLWPLNGEGGLSLTRDYPLGPATITEDHEHHESFWTAYGEVNEADYWEYNERTGYERAEEVTWGIHADFGWIRADNVWEDRNHQPVVREQREYRFYDSPAAARVFDLRVTFTAEFGDVHFGDTKEGGIVALRMADALTEGLGTGIMTNAEGKTGEKAVWGKPSAWLDYSGTLEGVGSRGVAIFDHPDNFGYPTRWHAREYGLVGANPFGLKHFTDGELRGGKTVNRGDSLTFRYRIFVHSGDVQKARVADRYVEYKAGSNDETQTRVSRP